mmetsp:Transcript_37234/g.52590  ORF Transcript_37234/g.52590 Transcript_37234/m.52590 type:complete len:98 (+) Transcript_37234:240-533(+)
MSQQTQNAPHQYNIPQYGVKIQYTANIEIPQEQLTKETKRIQEVLGTLFYYTSTVDCTMLPTIRSSITQQVLPSKKIMEDIVQLLKLCNKSKCNGGT